MSRRRPTFLSRASYPEWQLAAWADAMGLDLEQARMRARYVAPGTDAHQPRSQRGQGPRYTPLTKSPDDETVTGHTVSTPSHGARNRRSTTMSNATATPARKRAPKADPKTLSPEERAVIAPSGLKGAALARFIETGETGREQVAAAKAQREAAKKKAKHDAASARAKAAGTRPPVRKREGLSAIDAAAKVLRRARGPMKVADIAAKAIALPEFHTKGKTPELSIQARLYTAAKAGGVVVQVSRGTFDIRELNPDGLPERPAKKKTAPRKAAKAVGAAS
jgi:hypothetical protein